ncbi:hypothetical protein [Methylobacterium sp. J-070]|uniref:hypothetical protein n=1 Tax=Methylobacterium sp. J-070 TaxID=2836650 RepID=UPI001FBA38B1|nr:hypothetical protein [Methylobacterium sp. J-070]MCJ2048348.1 hypothetical protein [Methylobacterium sp. J-070]
MTLLTIVPPAQPLLREPSTEGDIGPARGSPSRQASPAGRDRLAGRHGALLEHLARALDMPAETFLDAPPDGEAGELFALVRHWLAIGDGQARRRVLSLARQEAERSGYSACA